jgi:3-methylcrotonyl-CoA carboxylase alpha subunit
MFQKILIANRGEIACRVMTTAARMGVATVAVYSDADARAKHVAMADEAVHIGPAPVGESYLRIERVIDASRATGAEAIHPGYGFLSENPDFVDAVAAAGLAFVGPPASAIRAMGLKDAAKALMVEAGVPVVPGYHGDNRDPDFLATEAEKIGYPVLIKARAGGGGKGMRLVEEPGAFRAALESAQREAQASFGDSACLIEKYVTRPRHVEIQVFGDSHGNVVHLFERDCSLQRRHQKVIEEAPAPDMPAEVREAMVRAAVEAAKAIGYQGAGTVEFIADGSGPLRTDGFWFMEMNTRLQVEHPVTEAVTGLDLVELQLRAAWGDPLPFRQEDLKIDGHAFEARVYAEDVARGFVPAIGRLAYFAPPVGVEFGRGPVRVDSGVRQGDAISPYYDPMIAKLIVHGPDRAAALNRLSAALAEFHVGGATTNLAFLAALARNPDFKAGRVDTGLIARDLETLVVEPETSNLTVAVAVLTALGLLRRREGSDPWESLAGWRQWSDAKHYALLERKGAQLERRITARGHGRYTVEGGSAPVELTVGTDPAGGLEITTDGHLVRARTALTGATVTVFISGGVFAFNLPDQLGGEDEEGAAGDVVNSPMPGLVRLLTVEAGKPVTRGDPLIVLEAMKMEHTLTAPRDGVVAEVLVKVGDQVTDGMVLLALESEASDG